MKREGGEFKMNTTHVYSREGSDLYFPRSVPLSVAN